MKKIFGIIWSAIKWLFAKIYELLGIVYTRILRIKPEHWFNFSLGLIITAFSAIVLHIEWAPALPVFGSAFYAFFRNMAGFKLDWKNYVAIAIGAVIIWFLTIV